ncbi:MAG: 3'(2'),5'-bisphosphate nucleotidase CysQ family protein, partial [Stellaceae bacterium]
MTASREELLDVARRAALAAGEEIMRVYAGEFEVFKKSDATPVTEADLAAERVIVAMLQETFPDIPIVSEELVEADGLPPAAARFWVVDPLDGTREFVARNGEFAVSIGLVEDGRPVLGVVHGPVQGVTYAACGPGTATRSVRSGMARQLAARPAPREGLVVIHSRSHENSRRLAEFLRDYPVQARKSCGSALKFG